MGESYSYAVTVPFGVESADVWKAAILTLRSHYPNIQADLDADGVCLRSEFHSEKYLRAAWLSAFFTEARKVAHMTDRQAIIERLMA